jgi:hypothetical protein
LRNRAADPQAAAVLREMQAILRSQVDPDEVTERGFAAQHDMLQGFARAMSEDELAGMLQGRLGAGQARILARQAKSQSM